MKRKLKEMMERLFTVPAASSLRGAGRGETAHGADSTSADARHAARRRGYGVLVLAALLCAMAAGAMAAVEPLRDRTAIQIADSAIAHLDLRTNRVYQLEDTIRVAHSASRIVSSRRRPQWR